MEKVRPWCGQPSDRGRLRNRTEHETGTARFTISEVAFDWQEPVVLQRKCGHPLPAERSGVD